MADTTAPEAQRAYPSPREWRVIYDTVDEIDADMHDAHRSLQALMGLLAGADITHLIKPNDLRALLQPIAGSVAQAFRAMCVLQVEDIRGPRS